jgi:FkbM family methyltransferase
VQYPIVTGSWRSPGGRSLTISYRENTNDWNTVSATLTGDEYRLPRGLSGHAVDIGGYLGTVGIALAADNPDLLVTIIEPVPPNAQLIRQNIAQNDLDHRITLIEGAASGDKDPVTVWYGYRGNEAAEHHAFVGNSTLAYANGGELEHETVTYTPVTLAELGEIAFLKIDCEGGEWSILAGDNSRIATIVGESHAVRGHKGRDIVDLLARTHDVTLSGDDLDGTCEFRAVPR